MTLIRKICLHTDTIFQQWTQTEVEVKNGHIIWVRISSRLPDRGNRFPFVIRCSCSTLKTFIFSPLLHEKKLNKMWHNIHDCLYCYWAQTHELYRLSWQTGNAMNDLGVRDIYNTLAVILFKWLAFQHSVILHIPSVKTERNLSSEHQMYFFSFF